ncbi:MAG TPA: hypothetical protein VKA74_06405 [Myxococcota bacterium]|nr:hypothetical protein [Myxococcota bacterium]
MPLLLLIGVGSSTPPAAVAAPWSDPDAAASDQSVSLAVFDGVWQRIGAEQDDESRLSAIDRALERLSWLVRKMAGRVLRQSTTPPPELRFVWQEGRLYEHRLQDDGSIHRRRVIPDGRMRPDRDGVEIAWQASPSELRLRWSQHQARGSTVFRLGERLGDRPGEAPALPRSGGALLVEYEIQVTAIDDVGPVLFQARFDRSATSIAQRSTSAHPVSAHPVSAGPR